MARMYVAIDIVTGRREGKNDWTFNVEGGGKE